MPNMHSTWYMYCVRSFDMIVESRVKTATRADRLKVCTPVSTAQCGTTELTGNFDDFYRTTPRPSAMTQPSESFCCTSVTGDDKNDDHEGLLSASDVGLTCCCTCTCCPGTYVVYR